MSTQPFDYAAILADLEMKRSAIETSIASLRSAMGLGALGQSSDLPASAPGQSVSLHNGEIPNGAFLGKSIPDAARLYLEILKKKQTSREIAEALAKGGMESTSKNFGAIVHNVLDRARKAPNSTIVKLGGHWGLASWYPKGVVSTNAAMRSAAKRSQKKQRKSKKTEGAKPPEVRVHTPHIQQPKSESSSAAPRTRDRIGDAFRDNPQAEFTIAELAATIGQKASVTQMVLGQMVKLGIAQKTSTGAYKAATA